MKIKISFKHTIINTILIALGSLVFLPAKAHAADWKPIKTLCGSPDESGNIDCFSVKDVVKVQQNMVEYSGYTYYKGDAKKYYVFNTIRVNCKTNQSIPVVIGDKPVTDMDWGDNMGGLGLDIVQWACALKNVPDMSTDSEGD